MIHPSLDEGASGTKLAASTGCWDQKRSPKLAVISQKKMGFDWCGEKHTILKKNHQKPSSLWSTKTPGNPWVFSVDHSTDGGLSRIFLVYCSLLEIKVWHGKTSAFSAETLVWRYMVPTTWIGQLVYNSNRIIPHYEWRFEWKNLIKLYFHSMAFSSKPSVMINKSITVEWLHKATTFRSPLSTSPFWSPCFLLGTQDYIFPL